MISIAAHIPNVSNLRLRFLMPLGANEVIAHPDPERGEEACTPVDGIIYMSPGLLVASEQAMDRDRNKSRTYLERAAYRSAQPA